MVHKLSLAYKVTLLVMLLCCSVCVNAQLKVSGDDNGHSIRLFDKNRSAAVVVSPEDFMTVKKAAQMLADDMMRAGAQSASATFTDSPKGRFAVLAGTVGHSKLIDKLTAGGKLDISPIADGYEQYIIKTVERPLDGVDKALVIAGSDRRGTAYGLLSVSESIGVSP